MTKFITISLIIGFCVFLAQDVIVFRSVPMENFQQHQGVISEEIMLADLLILKQKNDTVCIDVRMNAHYEYAHIPAAINWAVENPPSASLLQMLETVPNVIVYGTSRSERTVRAVEILASYGIAGVKIYSPGWEQWKAC